MKHKSNISISEEAFEENMLEGVLDFPSFHKYKKVFTNNFRAAAVRKKFEDEIQKTLFRIQEPQLQNNDLKFETEYSATVGIEWDKVPAAWKEKAVSELVEKYPLEGETISLWQWKNRGLKSGFKRNAHFTTPIEVSVRDPPGEVRRTIHQPTAREMYNRDFPQEILPDWFYPLPSSHGVVQILRDL